MYALQCTTRHDTAGMSISYVLNHLCLLPLSLPPSLFLLLTYGGGHHLAADANLSPQQPPPVQPPPHG